MPRRIVSLRLLLLCFTSAMVVFALLPHKAAGAHPLGNFTINHYSRLEFTGEVAHVTYVLDIAEIPTLQHKKRLDTDGDGALSHTEASAYLDDELPTLLKGIRLEVGNRVLPLRVMNRSATFVAGQGGLPTLRIEARLQADLPDDWEKHGVGYYTDRNYEDRLGWREIVVQGGPGVAIENSTVPSAGASDELRSYPQDSLSSPLDIRQAKFTLASGDGTASSDPADQVTGRGGTGAGGVPARVASLVSACHLSLSILALSLLAAFSWGAGHALTPGYGKAVVAAYLVGARGTVKHAGFLGLTVTLTHTAGVFALGAVTLYLSRYVLPETLYPWLDIVSGAFVVAIGLSLFCQRLRTVSRVGSAEERHTHGDGRDSHSHHDDAHVHAPHDHHPNQPRAAGWGNHGDHQHAHSHSGRTHSHVPPGADGSKVTWRSLLALGVSGGLVPCPAALVLLLGAISLGRPGFGMVLVVAFSAGLAIVLAGIGVLMINARRLFERFSFEAQVPRLLPIASALIISLVGIMIVVGSLGRVGIVR